MNIPHTRNTWYSALLAGALALAGTGAYGQTQTKPKPQAAPQTEPQEEYTEEEYDAYEKATKEKEPDPEKRAAAVMAFMEKYPKSKLQAYVVHEYQTLLADYNKAGNYAKLGPAAELWMMKFAPNDLTLYGYIADSALKLGNDKKFLEYGQKIYTQKPSGDLALMFAEANKKLGDEAKYSEWIDKAMADPKHAGRYDLPMGFVDRYMKEKNFAKAAEYARKANKAMESAQKPATTSDADWRKTQTAVKRLAHYLGGLNAYDTNKYAEAIQAMEQTLSVDRRFAPAHYYIALSLWKQDKVDDAIESFARAEILKDPEVSPQAKEHLEKLYKAIHNNTLIGVDKVYDRAKKALTGEASASN